MSKKAPKSKSADALNKLRAFEAVFKVACQQRGAPPHRALLRELQACIADASGATQLRTLTLEGPTVGAGVVCAAAAALAGYSEVTALRAADCHVGDEGLAALSGLLRASGGRWWRGPRLATLEVTGTRPGQPPAPPTAAAPTGGAAAASSGDVAPAAADVAGGLQAGEAAATAAAGAPAQQGAQGTSARSSISAAGALASARGPSCSSSGSRTGSAPAVVRPRTAPACGRGGVLGEHLAAEQQAAAEKQQRIVYVFDSGVRSSGLPASKAAPAPCSAASSSSGAEIGSGGSFPIQLAVAQSALRDRAPLPCELPQGVRRLRTPLQARSGCLQATLASWHGAHAEAAIAAQGLGNGVLQHRQQQQQQQHRHQQQQPQQQPCFTAAALKDLALALGASGLALSTLVLDFTLLGDAGIELLAPGLQRCPSLTTLSLRGCGLGPAGARALAAALTPPAAAAAAGASTTAAGGAAAAVASRRISRFRPPALSVAGGGAAAAAAAAAQQHAPWRGPALKALMLSCNPLGGSGLLALNSMLRQAGASLEALGLADIGLCSEDGLAIQGLVSALIAACSVIREVDLALNYMGDRAAGLLLPLPPARPTLKVLKLAPHLDRGLAGQLLALLAANVSAGGGGGGKKKKKGGKAAGKR